MNSSRSRVTLRYNWSSCRKREHYWPLWLSVINLSKVYFGRITFSWSTDEKQSTQIKHKKKHTTRAPAPSHTLCGRLQSRRAGSTPLQDGDKRRRNPKAQKMSIISDMTWATWRVFSSSLVFTRITVFHDPSIYDRGWSLLQVRRWALQTSSTVCQDVTVGGRVSSNLVILGVFF